MSRLGTSQLPCSSIHLSGLPQYRALPRGRATGKRCVLRCQADQNDKSIADKVPEAAQRTIDALSALLGGDEKEEKQTPSRPLQGKWMLLNSTISEWSPQNGVKGICLLQRNLERKMQGPNGGPCHHPTRQRLQEGDPRASKFVARTL